MIPLPRLSCTQWHELDEAHNDTLLRGKLGQAHDLVVVEAANDHRVELYRGEAQRLGRADRLEHFRQPVTPGDFLKLSRSSESRLIVTRPSPASLRRLAKAGKPVPLVVNDRSRIESMAAICETRFSTPLRRSGSPPVIRTLFIPSEAATRVTRVISSKVRICDRGFQG